MRLVEIAGRQFISGRRKCHDCGNMFSFTLRSEVALKFIGRPIVCYYCGDWERVTAERFDISYRINHLSSRGFDDVQATGLN